VTSVNSKQVRLDTSLELFAERMPALAPTRVLASLVATAGSTYRKPGARMLIMKDGSYLGLLSGGCLEADLKLHADEVLHGAPVRAVEYDMRGPDDVLFGIGAGCEGALRVLLEPAGPEAPASAALVAAADITSRGGTACLVSVHESRTLPLGTYEAAQAPRWVPAALAAAVERALAEQTSRDFTSDAGELRAFIHVLAPPPHLLVCGGGPDAQPVAAAARALGWRVTVVDHRTAYADPRRFPGARVLKGEPLGLAAGVDLERCHAAVVMSHHLLSDAAYLRVLSSTAAPAFIGLLGPSARRRRLWQELDGPAADALSSRLRGPVGFDIGACTPEGIALSMVSQIHAFLAGRPVARPQQLGEGPDGPREG
jgi:xanthine/CO dehydrogenase XdhC/CoxF family maturation factor